MLEKDRTMIESQEIQDNKGDEANKMTEEKY